MKKITLIILLFCAGFVYAQDDNYSIKSISDNTSLADFGVTYYGDSLAVFASSRRDKSIRNRTWAYNNQPYLNLFVGTLGEEGEIDNVKSFSDVINTKFHESNVVFTKDLKTVYFSRNNYLDKKIAKDEEGWVLIQLYKATVSETGEWTDITPMPFNNDNYQTGHPTLNAAEDRLYFTSDMPGTMGLTDIFVVSINADGSYGEPKNLGSNVNSSGKEMFPFISDNDEMFFSSDGRADGKGGLDIYATKVVGDQATIPGINLEFPINTLSDDFSLVYKPGEKWGHFSSNRKGGKGDDDIYYFKEEKSVFFGCSQVASGVVREQGSGALLPGAKVILIDEQGTEIESTIVDEFGAFNFKVDCTKPYKVVGSKEYYKKDTKPFTTTDVNGYKMPLELSLEPTGFINRRGLLMVDINPIYFDLDKSDIRIDAAIELEKVVRIMNNYPEIKIVSGSHTDSRASDSYNVSLSDRRAKSTVAWIINRGIDASRITGKGYGETELVNNCTNDVKCSEAEHQLNRRTEFVIQNPDVINE